MKPISNGDSLSRQVTLLVAASLQTLAMLTIVSNFDWNHPVAMIFYGLTALIYYVVFLLWKQ